MREGDGTTIVIKDYSGVSGYKLLLQWFNEHNLWNTDRFVLPFICRKSKFYSTRLDFSVRASKSRWDTDIKHYFDQAGLPGYLYTGHSFRPGGTTDMFEERVPYPTVKKVGRWKSEAVLRYYKTTDQGATMAATAFASRRQQYHKSSNL